MITWLSKFVVARPGRDGIRSGVLSLRSLLSRAGLQTPVAGLALAAVVLLTGCMHPGLHDPARTGPFFTPRNHVGEQNVAGIRRVVVLPLWAGEGIAPESAASLDEAFVTAVRRENRFEVVAMTREACLRRFRAESLCSVSALPSDLLATLQREYAADAVLLIDLTTFHAYKPLRVGVRAKLAAIDGTRLIWSFDQVFAADDPAVANSARRHFIKGNRDIPTDLTVGALQSPTRFATYVAAAMANTLPPVYPPISFKEGQ